jgi:hypothetical protein
VASRAFVGVAVSTTMGYDSESKRREDEREVISVLRG